MIEILFVQNWRIRKYRTITKKIWRQLLWIKRQMKRIALYDIQGSSSLKRMKLEIEPDPGQQQHHPPEQRQGRYEDVCYSLDVTELASDCHEEVCTSNALISKIIRVQTPLSLSPGSVVEPTVNHCDAVCGEDVRPRSNFRARSSSEIPHTNRLQFACAVCERYFTSEKYLSMHLSLHKPNIFDKKDNAVSTVRTFGAAFENNAPLTIIGASSSSSSRSVIAPKTCNFCHKTFTQNSNYKNHMRTHEDERPFVCDICSIGFKERYVIFTNIWWRIS